MNSCQLGRLSQGLCGRCGDNPLAESSKFRCKDCLHIDAQKQLNRRKKNKTLVFEAYGGFVCNCCGETMNECLSIDHLNNNGHVHRKEIGSQGSAFYAWLVSNNFPPGYQVLCMNCQFGKKHNGGVCPHQQTETIILKYA